MGVEVITDVDIGQAWHTGPAMWGDEIVIAAAELGDEEAIAELKRRTGYTEERHGSHNQKSHGRRGGQVISSGEAGDLATRLHEPDGGYTYNPRTAKDVTKGFAVATHEDRGRVLTNAKSAGASDVSSFAEANSDLLAEPRNMLGGWHDPDTGKAHLDISEVFDDRDEAIAVGRKHNQISIMDLSTFETIPTGGTGSEQRAIAPTKVERERALVGDTCSDCVNNTDPANVPLHPGCDCDIVTREVEVGTADATAIIDAVLRHNVGSVIQVGEPPLPNENVRLDERTLAAIPLKEFRYSDLVKWFERVDTLNDLSEMHAAVFAASDPDVLANLAVLAAIEPVLASAAAGGTNVVRLLQKRSAAGVFVVVLPPSATPEQMAEAYRLVTKPKGKTDAEEADDN